MLIFELAELQKSSSNFVSKHQSGGLPFLPSQGPICPFMTH